MAKLLDGKAISEEIRSELRSRIADLASIGIKPGLAMVLVGEDAASNSYVRSKTRVATGIGIEAVVKHFPTDVSEDELLAEIHALNASAVVDAILVQLPLPEHLNVDKILEAVSPEKDVDGFHPYNVGRYISKSPLIWPCTPSGILEILQRSKIAIEGRTAVIVGRSKMVGSPVAQLMLRHNATVIQCHSKTVDLEKFTRLADILVSAVGQPHVITATHVKADSVVIDVGMNRVDGQLIGDVDFSAVSQKVAAITPVPGGVGPLTVTMLMYNTVHLTSIRRGKKAVSK